jgi:hypothetical protein
MPVEQIVSLLIAERDRLSRAIEALQGPTKGRGRPANVVPSAPVKKKAAWSAAKRKAQGERMKAYWEKRRRATK